MQYLPERIERIEIVIKKTVTELKIYNDTTVKDRKKNYTKLSPSVKNRNDLFSYDEFIKGLKNTRLSNGCSRKV